MLYGGVALFFAAMFLAAVFGLTSAVLNPREPNKILAGIAVCSAVSGFFGWIVPLLIFCRNPIRALEVDQGLIAIDNVSEAYVNAVQATRPH